MNPYNENPNPNTNLENDTPRMAAAPETPTAQEKSAEVPATARHASPRHKKSAGKALFDLVGGIVPHTGDSPLEIVRKCVFVIALVVLIGSVSYLFNDIVVLPKVNAQTWDSIKSNYTPGVKPDLTDEEENWDGYPEGMSEDFKKLYYMNNDTRGVLTYRTTGSKDLFDGYITNMPVVQTTDNEFYLTHDFQKTENKAGALYFDYRNNITLGAKNKNLIIYGHNLNSGQMFTRLNQLLTPNKYNARSAATLSLNTLYEQATYKVFAVMVINNDEEDGPIFQYLRTQFADDEDFMRFTDEIRARSIYNFGNVDILPSDELLMLSTCNSKGWVHFDDGRTVIVARKVREGESTDINTSLIDVNEDVIMPLGWYVNQGLEPHPYYTDPSYQIERTPYGPGGPTTGTTPPVTDPGTQAPTEPTDSVTDPTQAPTDPTDPVTDPTQAPTDPTDPVTDPTQAPTDPTDPVTDPTEAPTEPTDPVTDPTEAPTESTDPATGSTEGPTESTDPVTGPTESTDGTSDQPPAQETDDPQTPEG